MKNRSNLHKFWWLYIPVVAIVAQIVMEMALDISMLRRMHSEGGPHEILQFFVIAMACAVAVRALFVPAVKTSKGLFSWFAMAALCSFYVAGEEISWGQHILNWSTPEYWAQVNDQNETNLHNTSAWLDQKPRILLEIGVIAGGLLIPLLRQFRPALLPVRFAVIYPPAIMAVTAGIFLALKLADTIADVMHITLFQRVSEVQELYLFYFVLIYIVWLRRTLRN